MKTSRICFASVLALAACEARTKEPRFTREPEPSAAPQAAEQAVKEPAPSAQEELARVDAGSEAVSASPAAQNVPDTGTGAAPRFVREPTTPDPLGGKFTIKDATQGLAGKGALSARIETGYGVIECKLFEDKTPNTVANFVGLARGLRPFWDAKSAAWVKRPTYDGTTFHRAVDGFMIQGGDYLGDGTGGVGYEIADELVKGWAHDRAGLLCMANRGPNTNGGQFFITDGAAPHLTQMNTFTIFGECKPLDVIHKIAVAPRPNPHSERPEPPVPIKRVQIVRK
jgi:peptidyl-prolyl cis-trans isomerase A (cyclophilin A)